MSGGTGYRPLLIKQGSTFDETWTWYPGGAYNVATKTAIGSPVDLTGWSARMQIRRRAEDPGPPLLSLTDGDGITLGGEAGTIRIVIDADVSSAWTWRSGEYDLEMVDPDGKPWRKLEGDVKVSPEVTREEES
jgi:hypothetical protein